MTTGIEVWVQPPPVDGTPQNIRALRHDTGYSVKEESIGVDPSDTTGATGTIQVELGEVENRVAVKRLARHDILLSDKNQGSTKGIVRLPSGSLTGTSLTADQRLILLASVRTAQPFVGTLREYVAYLFSLVGIRDGFVVDGTAANVQVAFPGWNDDVYLQLKRLLIPRGFEITLASNNIVVRPIRGRVTIDKRDSEFNWSMDENNLALSVEGYWYSSRQAEIGLAYPAGGWNEDVQVYQVDAGEIIEIPIQMGASLSSVNQPIAQDYVDRYHTGPTSVYSVIGADNKPIKAKQWQDEGGRLTVSIGEDTRTLIVRIVGARLTKFAPFRIATTAGPNDTYSSLRITGTGVFFDRHGPISLGTTVSPDETSVEVGTVVDNEFITSESMLRSALMWTASRYGGPRQSITVRTTGINRIDESGSYAYSTFLDFDLDAMSHNMRTLQDFDDQYEGLTFEQFDQQWVDRATQSFANQAFGNICGARTFRDGVWYRIRTADIGPSGLTYTAENDTTVQDFDTWMATQLELRGLPNTIASFDLLMGEYMTFGQFDAAPLYLED